jgi:DinB superfamily
MHRRLTELLDYVHAQTDDLRKVYDAVPPERRAVRPEPGRWSPAEIVHHLVIVDRRINHRLSAMIEEARAFPPESEASPLLSTIAERVTVRDRRFKTSEASEPRDTDPSRIWDDLAAVRRELEEVVATADGLALGKVFAPHPALGPLCGYDWLAFVGAHAARHADQIREQMSS